MSHSIHKMPFLERFTCLGDKCEDTCCKGWGMQVDAKTIEKYTHEAPDLLAAVDQHEAAQPVMKRDAKTDYCIKFEDGLCGIHKKQGAEFLGDACYFYPRTTRAVGNATVMTATPSCPEIVRLAIMQESAAELIPGTETRLPFQMKNYLPEGMKPEDGLALHQLFLKVTEDTEISAERMLLRLVSVANSLATQPVEKWAEAAPFYLKMAEGRIPPAEHKLEDPFHLLHALGGLIVASRKQHNERLRATMQTMEETLTCPFDWENILITPADDSALRYAEVKKQWDERHAAAYAPLFKRWLRLQLSNALFPFAGFGNTLFERVMIIAVRFATMRLALMSAHYNKESIEQAEQVRIMQSLSRLLDHLSDPAFSLQIYTEAGWTQESRLSGLLE